MRPLPRTPALASFTTVVDDAQIQPLKPDIDLAWRSLNLLDPNDDVHCFQLIAEHSGGVNRTLHGTIDAQKASLVAANKGGSGVFVTPNKVREGASRTTDNVIRVRALFADADDPAKIPDVETAIAGLGLPPAMIVETSPGKRHYYWLTDDCPLSEFKEVQSSLAMMLGTDPAICDLPRVMRLPGFYHLKGEPFMTRLVTP